MNNHAVYLAWRSPGPQSEWAPVGRLDYDQNSFRFVYTKGALKNDFVLLPGMEDTDKVYTSEKLFPIFSNRLFNSKRADYNEFLSWGGLDESATPEPLSILGLGQGKRKTDQFEVFPCPTKDEDGNYLFQFFVRGVRYMGEASKKRIESLKVHEPVVAMADFQNEQDPRAVMLRTKDDRVNLGFIPKYLSSDFHRLLETCSPDFLQVVVKRVNKFAPPQYKVLCEFRACWPKEYEPFTAQDFQAVPDGVPAYCEHQ